MIILLRDIKNKQIKHILNAYYEVTKISSWYIDPLITIKRYLFENMLENTSKFFGDPISTLDSEARTNALTEVLKNLNKRAIMQSTHKNTLYRLSDNSFEANCFILIEEPLKFLIDETPSPFVLFSSKQDDTLDKSIKQVVIKDNLCYEEIKEKIAEIVKPKIIKVNELDKYISEKALSKKRIIMLDTIINEEASDDEEELDQETIELPVFAENGGAMHHNMYDEIMQAA
jgi:hypothetical protein